MCTAITFHSKDFYFGRTLDYDFSYQEEITLMPRHFPLIFSSGQTLTSHHAVLGMAYVVDGYPLYYDGFNEKGLAIAGLNFPGFSQYQNPKEGKHNIAQYELIPWVLSQCDTTAEAAALLTQSNLTESAFSPELPPAPLHWLLADKHACVTVESTKHGLEIHQNPVGILTNSPPFPQQMLNLSNYMQLSPQEPDNRFAKDVTLAPYSRGMGAMGLPGDLSSQSRFVRGAFTKLNATAAPSEEGSVLQFFHILATVGQTKGCCRLGNGNHEFTIYTSCCNADKGVYYYTTYENPQISAVNMHRCNLDSDTLIRYPLQKALNIHLQN